MNPTTQPRPGSDLEPHQSELSALRSLLAIGQGDFSLSIAVCNAPVLRDRLIADLRRDTPGVCVLAIPAGTIDVYGFAREQPQISGATALFVVGLEACISGESRDQHTVWSLNASRDLWPAPFPMPVVFWLPEYAARTLSESARDFWRVRSHLFSFLIRDDEPTPTSMASGLGRHSAAASLSHDEKLARIAELEQRISQIDVPTSEMRPHLHNWFLELATLHAILGDHALAITALERSLAINGQDHESSYTASSLGSLGLVYRRSGNLDRAEDMHKQALAINEIIDDQQGVASQYGNLGLIYHTRGDLDLAEEMHLRALAIHDKLGHQEGMANGYGNIGAVYHMRGYYDRAEAMYQKALTIDEKLGRQEGIANAYGNLGQVYLESGDLKQANLMLQKALAIEVKIGRQAGAAVHYGILGRIAEKCGDRKQARELWTQARDIFARIGMPLEVAQLQKALDAYPSHVDAEATTPGG